MREIKFRLWDDKLKKFDYDFRITSKGKEIKYIQYQGDNYYDCELMQYTGLKDKNGKEIYEGDIVIRYYDYNSMSVVKWDDALTISMPYYDSGDDYEVIGNIYENPELLEEN